MQEGLLEEVYLMCILDLLSPGILDIEDIDDAVAGVVIVTLIWSDCVSNGPMPAN